MRRRRIEGSAVVRRSAPRGGFVLLEVIIAMLILGVVLASLAALLYSVSQGSFKSIGGAYRNAVLLQEVNRLEALPFELIPVGTTTTTVTAPPYAHTRTVTVTSPKTDVKSITLVITPTIRLYRPDTAKFIRTLGMTTNAFNTQ